MDSNTSYYMMNKHILCFLKNGPTPASSLFIFVLFKHKFYRKKTVGFSSIWTWIFGVESEHADHLITTTAPRTHLVSWGSVSIANTLVRKQSLGLGWEIIKGKKHLQSLKTSRGLCDIFFRNIATWTIDNYGVLPQQSILAMEASTYHNFRLGPWLALPSGHV